MLLPPCEATMMQACPAPVALLIATVAPLSVHPALPAARVKVGDKPEDAVALTVKFGSPYVLFDSAVNVIVCAPLAIVKLRDTSAAGA